MSITDDGSVLILGAGVSAPFGLSLGGAMIDVISKALDSEIKLRNSDGRHDLRSKLTYAMRGGSSFIKMPIHAAIAYKHWNQSNRDFNLQINDDLKKLTDVCYLLKNQTSETIDDFIIENSSYSEITKICVAAHFVLSCYKLENENLIRKAFEKRHCPSDSGKQGERNWIHLLINIVRQGIRAGSVSNSSKINIITFNYDGILENVLLKQFSNSEISRAPYTEYINIIHVHGECGDIPDSLGNPAETCLKWAGGIHVVQEDNVPDYIVQKRNDAKSIIAVANEIYVCGFSFAGPNCRLLGLESPDPNLRKRRTIRYCNYDGNMGISESVERYKVESTKIPLTGKRAQVLTAVKETRGTADRPISVSDWLKAGYLGELPG